MESMYQMLDAPLAMMRWRPLVQVDNVLYLLNEIDLDFLFLVVSGGVIKDPFVVVVAVDSTISICTSLEVTNLETNHRYKVLIIHSLLLVKLQQYQEESIVQQVRSPFIHMSHILRYRRHRLALTHQRHLEFHHPQLLQQVILTLPNQLVL